MRKKCSYSFAYEKSFDCYIMKIPLLRYEHPKFKIIGKVKSLTCFQQKLFKRMNLVYLIPRNDRLDDNDSLRIWKITLCMNHINWFYIWALHAAQQSYILDSEEAQKTHTTSSGLKHMPKDFWVEEGPPVPALLNKEFWTQFGHILLKVTQVSWGWDFPSTG